MSEVLSIPNTPSTSMIEVPDTVFINIDPKYLSLIAATPNALLENPWELYESISDTKNSNPEGIVVELNNLDGIKRQIPTITIEDCLNIFRSSKVLFSKDLEVIELYVRKVKESGQMAKLTIEILMLFLNALLDSYKSRDPAEYYKTLVLEEINKKIKGGLLDIKFTERFSLKRVIYKGIPYTPDQLSELRSLLVIEVNNMMEGFPFLLENYNSVYLYRMPRKEEWETMRRNRGVWVVRSQTNFVSQQDYDSDHSFVDAFKRDTEYSGIPIRVKPQLNVYGKKLTGGSVVIASILPHCVEIEYLDEEANEWKKLG